METQRACAPTAYGVQSQVAASSSWLAIAALERACCCSAKPKYRAVLPARERRTEVDLLLCGHHYRASELNLLSAGARLYDAAGRPLPAPAGR